ncbi:DUF4198 domain-containing protein [Actinobacillus equuli]|uniref:DUF4198 domain-containing protein n=1 Tax=Actinobacillus equuli TaxID=718 RepID=UPI0024420958|nr:DUF4198 domain-containing protein [Actinobacillus equuli]WGE58910.1 DUF4198 domain-containing protein [Actinobacillus equuli subsp. haemolyticus]WGE60492.1 DUF4198 domain-containing protein [Actinobacillus equuli subsp. haemolyticus]
MSLKSGVLGLISLLSISIAQAHNVWLEPTKNTNEYVVKFGHETTEPYPETKLQSIQLLQKNGVLSSIKPQFNQGEAYFNAGRHSMVFLEFNNGVWSKLPSGKYVEKTKAQEPTAVLSLNPIKLGKAITVWNADSFKPHAVEYELIPLSKPVADKAMDILVLRHGKPASGIKVGLGEDKPFNLTNENGIAQFTPTAGYNKVWAEFEEKGVVHPDYTERTIEYMLTFEVK